MAQGEKKAPEDVQAVMGYIGATIVRSRNPYMSLVHHSIGQLLDCGGTIDQVKLFYVSPNINTVSYACKQT